LRARVSALLRLVEREGDRNPTSGLPGGHAIEKEIARRVAKADPFAVCYLDLDNFKAFADTFGFATADIVIRGLGAAIRDSAYAVAGEGGGDFVGHIGGDDFIVVTTQPHAEAIVNECARRFRDVIARAVGDEAAMSGSFTGVDRDGHIKRFPLARVSAAVMNVCPENWVNLAHFGMMAADAKRRAKQLGAGSILVESV
jgi:GGDEF domain-containing protein